MTYLEAANKAFTEARTAFNAGDFSTAARLFHHAKEMFEHYAHATGDKRKLADHAASWTRTAIQRRDAAQAA